MSSGEENHRLIKSLSKQEISLIRSAFKSKRENPDHLKLFNYMIRKKTFDDESARGVLGLTKMQYKNLKYYTFKALLRTLATDNFISSRDSNFQITIQSVRELISRGLYRLAQKQLSAAKDMATREELFSELIELFKLDLNLALKEEHEPVILEKFSEHEKIIFQYQNLNQYRQLLLRAQAFRSKNLKLSQANKAEFNLIFNDTLLENEKRAKSLRALELFLTIHLIKAIVQNEYDSVISIAQRTQKLFEENHFLKTGRVHHHIVSMNSIFPSLLFKGDYDKCDRLIAHTRLLLDQITAKADRAVAYGNIFLREVIVACIQKEKTRINKLLIEFEKEYGALQRLFPDNQYIPIFYRAAELYFYQGNHKLAKKFLNKVLMFSGKEKRDDFLSFARIMMMMMHYDQGNITQLQSLQRSTSRYLKRRKGAYKSEELFVDYIRRISFSEKAESQTLFHELHKQLKALSNKEAEVGFYLDLSQWVLRQLDKKVNNK